MNFIKMIVGLSLLFSFSPCYADFDNLIPDTTAERIQKKEKTEAEQTKKIPAKKNELTPTGKHPDKKPKKKLAPETAEKNKQKSLIEKEFGEHDNNAPIHFSGQYAEGSRKTGILNLVGNTVIIQDDTTLKSNKAQIFAQPGMNENDKKRKFQRALAIGNVRIYKKNSSNTPEIKATGDSAELLVEEKILTLKGHAKIWRGDEYLNANIIKIDLKTGEYSALEPEGTVSPGADNQKANAT